MEQPTHYPNALEAYMAKLRADTYKMAAERSNLWSNIGKELTDLIEDIQRFSTHAFGKVEDRGPIGPLKHLAKEALEAAANPTDIVEYADCLIVFLDALWRQGFTIEQLLEAAHWKMKRNWTRRWPKEGIAPDMPIEHDRTGEDKPPSKD